MINEFRMYRSENNKTKFDIYRIFGTMQKEGDESTLQYEVVLKDKTFEEASKFIESKEQI